MSIIGTPFWNRIRPYLHITHCDKDGTQDDPRIRIEFLGLPPKLVHEALFLQMACVACGNPVNPLRRREGDIDRLYYAPACLVRVRIKCSRGAEARTEYDRFKDLANGPLAPDTRQMSLF